MERHRHIIQDSETLLLKVDDNVPKHLLRRADLKRVRSLIGHLAGEGFDVYIGGGVINRLFSDGPRKYNDVDMLAVHPENDDRAIEFCVNLGRIVKAGLPFRVLNHVFYPSKISESDIDAAIDNESDARYLGGLVDERFELFPERSSPIGRIFRGAPSVIDLSIVSRYKLSPYSKKFSESGA